MSATAKQLADECVKTLKLLKAQLMRETVGKRNDFHEGRRQGYYDAINVVENTFNRLEAKGETPCTK